MLFPWEDEVDGTAISRPLAQRGPRSAASAPMVVDFDTLEMHNKACEVSKSGLERHKQMVSETEKSWQLCSLLGVARRFATWRQQMTHLQLDIAC